MNFRRPPGSSLPIFLTISFHSSAPAGIITLILTAILLFAPAALAAKYAVVLIDMQEGFMGDGISRTEDFRTKRNALVKKQIEMLRWAKQRGFPVLVFEYKGHGETLAPLKEALTEFPPDQVRYVTKTTDNGFYNRAPSAGEAHAILTKWGSKHLLMAGINGNACVRHSLVGATMFRFDVTIANDLVGSFNIPTPTYPERSKSWFECRYDVSTHMMNFLDRAEEMYTCEDYLKAS